MDFPLGNKKTNPSLRAQREFLQSQDIPEVGKPFHKIIIVVLPELVHVSVELLHG